MADLLHYAPPRAVDENGQPVAGAMAYFYDTGTTSRRDTYTDASFDVANPWPLVADGSGFFPPAFVAGATPVKVVIQDAGGATLPGYPVDPVVRQQTTSTGAADVPFTATVEIPADNVQDAIEMVQANTLSPLADYGIGVTGTAPLLTNIDLTNIASGFYSYDTATLGTYPTGVTAAAGGIVMLFRRNSASARMILYPATQDAPGYERRMASSVWGAWVRYADDAAVVKNTGAETIAGAKTFAAQTAFGGGLKVNADTGSASFVSNGAAARVTQDWLIGATTQWTLNLQTDGDLNFQPAAAQTFRVSDNLVWHSGNDGDASGLDADLLDGHHAAAFPRLAVANTFSAANTFTGNVSIDPNTAGIIFNSNGVATRATAIWQIGGATKWSANIQTNGNLNFQAAGSEDFLIGGQKAWTAGNDGSGSGLDADLLDGFEAAAFARLASANTYTAGNTYDANVTINTTNALISFDGGAGADRTMWRGRIGTTNHWAAVLQSDGDLNFNNVSGGKSLQWDGNDIYTSANIKSGLNATGNAPIYATRAWVDYKGTSPQLIRASGNVTSVTVIGTGRYRVNLAAAMPSVNYAVQATGGEGTTGTPVTVSEYGTKTAAAFTINCYSGGSAADLPFIYACAVG